jgi:hypothetical protein
VGVTRSRDSQSSDDPGFNHALICKFTILKTRHSQYLGNGSWSTSNSRLEIMANSKYSYVRDYELADSLLPNTFVVIRIDGHGFHRFSTIYEFEKPNDRRALELMNAAARKVMESEIGTDCVMAFGESDEYRCEVAFAFFTCSPLDSVHRVQDYGG